MLIIFHEIEQATKYNIHICTVNKIYIKDRNLSSYNKLFCSFVLSVFHYPALLGTRSAALLFNCKTIDFTRDLLEKARKAVQTRLKTFVQGLHFQNHK